MSRFHAIPPPPLVPKFPKPKDPNLLVLVLFLGVCAGYLASCPRAGASDTSTLSRIATALEGIRSNTAGGLRCK